MIESEDFIGVLAEQGIDFFCGVPDSLLQDFCAFLADSCNKDRHIITANEGNAVALASGHYLATGRPGLVYMQNSGLGNAVNPLLSLADAGVYGIPVLLLIGWRGEPGTADEPQHATQGRDYP
jgi:phosphonopyruvate decarboxylase